MKKLIIKNRNKIFFVDFDDIISLNSCGRYTTIITEEKEYMVCKNLGLMEKELPENFFRIHHSTIINIHRIFIINCREIHMSSGHSYKIAKGRKKETIDYISHFRDNSS